MMKFVSLIIDNRLLNAFRDSYTLLTPIYIIATVLYVFGQSFDQPLFKIPIIILVSGYSLLTFISILYQLETDHHLFKVMSGVIFILEILVINYQHFIQNISIFGIISTLIFLVIFNHSYEWIARIKMSITSIAPAVCNSLNALIHGLLITILGTVVGLLWSQLGLFEILNKFVYQIALGLDGFWTIILVVGLIGCFWIFGINAGSQVNTIFRPFLLLLAMSNLVLGTSHIITEQFFDLVWLGGSGATLGCIMALKFSNDPLEQEVYQQSRSVAVFNINEPVIFGLPIVGQKRMMIPFIMAPLVVAFLQFGAMKSGLVPSPNGIIIPWITPPILSGIIVTGSIRGGIMQLVTIAVSGLIYYPFLKIK